MRYSHCRVPGCLSKTDGDIQFFNYNIRWDPIIRENCGVSDCSLPKQSLICTRHFEKKFLRKFHFQQHDNQLMTDLVLVRGAYPTIFHTDILPQTSDSRKLCTDEENDEYSDSKICNSARSIQSDANPIHQIASQSISNSDILSRYLSDTYPTFKSYDISPTTLSRLNNKIVNVSCSKSEEPYMGPERRRILSTAAGPSRFDSDILGSEISNIHSPKRWFKTTQENKDLMIKNENNLYYQQKEVIKQEIIDDELDGITKGCLIEQTNCLLTDNNVERDLFALNGHFLSDHVREDTTRLDEGVSMKGISNECSSVVAQSNGNFGPKVIDLFKFGSDVFVNEILRNSDPNPTESYHCAWVENIEKTNKAPGPSRSDNEVLNDSIKRLKTTHKKDELMGLPDVVVKKEIIDDDIDEITENCQMKQANFACTAEDMNLKKRYGSLLNKTEIKREKIDDEVDSNENNFLQDQITVKKEIKDENCIYIKEYNSMGKESENFEETNNDMIQTKGKRLLEEAEFFDRVNKCVLCDTYIEGTLKQHNIEHHQSGIFFSCPYCDNSSTKTSSTKNSSKAIYYEMKKHKKIFQLNCEFCGGKFANWIDLTVHMDATHEDMINQKCKLCGYQACTYRILIHHIVLSHNGKMLTHCCKHCNFVTMNSSVLQIHIEAKHTEKSVPLHHTSSDKKKEPIHPSCIRKAHNRVLNKCPCCDFKTCRCVTIAKNTR